MKFRRNYVGVLMMALLLMCACSQSVEPDDVVRKAIEKAEEKTMEEYGFMEEKGDMILPAGHFARLKEESRVAYQIAVDIAEEATGGEDSRITENSGYMDKLKEYLNAHYTPILDRSIAEIEGKEIECDYHDGMISQSKVVIERDPNSSQDIRLRMELTLAKPSYSRIVSYYIGSYMGESSIGAANLIPVEPQVKHIIDAGKKVKAYISLNSIKDRGITALVIDGIR